MEQWMDPKLIERQKHPSWYYILYVYVLAQLIIWRPYIDYLEDQHFQSPDF